MLDFINQLEKADLHVHLEGTVSTEVFFELCKRNDIDPLSPVKLSEDKVFTPPKDPNNIVFNDFLDFASYYLKISEVIRNKDDINLIASEFAKSCREQNIVQAELYFTPQTHLTLGKDIDLLFQGLKEAQETVEKDFGIVFRWIFDIVRNATIDGSEVIEHALKAQDMGVDVCAIGLAGDERGARAETFAKTFLNAKKKGFEVLAHSGEQEGVRHIQETLEHLRPLRVGHALSALECKNFPSAEAVIESCPWSNVLLGNISKEAHPALKQHLEGIPVCICSDDPGIFKKNLNDNYLLVAELGASKEELAEMAQVSLDARILR